MDIDAQIVDLQIRLAYQEDIIQSLSETVAGQDLSIAQLKNRYRVLQDRFNDLKGDSQSEPAIDERPPHY